MICARKGPRKLNKKSKVDRNAMARQKHGHRGCEGQPLFHLWEHLRAALAAAKGLVCVCFFAHTPFLKCKGPCQPAPMLHGGSRLETCGPLKMVKRWPKWPKSKTLPQGIVNWFRKAFAAAQLSMKQSGLVEPDTTASARGLIAQATPS